MVVVLAEVAVAADEGVGLVVVVAVEYATAVLVVAEHMVADNAQNVDVVLECTVAAEVVVDYVFGKSADCNDNHWEHGG